MSEEATSLMDLPSPILLQILCTLPPTTLLYVKTLSKSFLNLTLDSEFTKLSRSASIIIHQFYSSRTASRTNTLKLLKFVVDNFDHDPNDDLDLQLYFPIDTFLLVGSVHGFVCFNYFFGDVDSIYILNPTTREYIILPEPQRVRKWPNLVTYGFGFDPVRFEYKVVRIYQEEIRDDDTNGFCYYKSEAQVYTLGKLGYWRNSVEHIMLWVNLYAKIHWLVYDAKGNESICSFDLENELFESFPTAPKYNKKRYWYSRSLGVFGRCLCVCDNYADTHFEVWVMKEYGTTSSWVKEIVINISPECNDWLGNEMIYMLKVLEDGEVLFMWRDDFLFLHHPVKKTLKKLDVCTGNILASSHVSSSFSLKNFEGEVVNVF
ncbi:F-box/kelch-repeat protein At3g06240-like [Solanum stenotomum]|uniref:F-box/kelch-repeat protein At3g06240-like n=1 Tax=Solanum stenotomum TaxID=172797 RepID=UPI0020D19921|nr:F-box/kelch-repeat protein At3g06240-like [Solanum stenotomum]